MHTSPAGRGRHWGRAFDRDAVQTWTRRLCRNLLGPRRRQCRTCTRLRRRRKRAGDMQRTGCAGDAWRRAPCMMFMELCWTRRPRDWGYGTDARSTPKCRNMYCNMLCRINWYTIGGDHKVIRGRNLSASMVVPPLAQTDVRTLAPESSRTTTTRRLHSSYANSRRQTRKPRRYRPSRTVSSARRKRLEKQVQEDAAAAEETRERLRKREEALDEKNGKLATLKKEYSEALMEPRKPRGMPRRARIRARGGSQVRARIGTRAEGPSGEPDTLRIEAQRARQPRDAVGGERRAHTGLQKGASRGRFGGGTLRWMSKGSEVGSLAPWSHGHLLWA